MDGLVKINKFAPSQRPYAIKRSSLRVDDRGKVTSSALWAGRKSGVTTVSVGVLWGYRVPSDPDGFLANLDMRYGGDAEARWDGETLWAKADCTEGERASLLRACTDAIAHFPNVPAGWDGWYYTRKHP